MNASVESTSVGWGEYLVWGLLAATLLLAVGSYWWAASLAGQEQRLVRLLDLQQIRAQALARQALAAANGNGRAFQDLAASRDAIGNATRELAQPGAGLPDAPTGPEADAPMAAVKAAWRGTADAVESLLGTREAVLLLWRRVSEFEAFAADTLLKSDELVNVMVETGASPEQVYAATRQLMLLERLAHNLRRALTGGADAREAAERFNRDVVHFRQVTQGLLAGDDKLGIEAVADSEARALLDDILAAMGGEREDADAALAHATALVGTQRAAEDVGLAADTLAAALTALMQAYRSQHVGRAVADWAGHGFAALVAILALTLLFLTTRRRAAADAAMGGPGQPHEPTEQGPERRSQAAMRQLLGEVNALADGDLGVTAAVTQEVTGDVAQAVNDVVAKFRELVALASEVVVGVETTVAAADASPAASGNMDSTELKALTRQLLALAEEGTAMAAKVAHALDATRGSVREGAVALQRATERCREVGDLSGLVDNMADEANILALNTAIHASSGGGSGRTENVVADDVQQLAQRLGKTSQRIETQMGRIKAGIHEAMDVANEIEVGVEASAREVREASVKTGEKLQTLEAAARQWIGSEGAKDQAGVTDRAEGTLREPPPSAGRELSERLTELRSSAEALKQLLAGLRNGPGQEVAAAVSRGRGKQRAVAGSGEGENREVLPATLGLREKARSG